MKVWKFIQKNIINNIPVTLLLVTESIGSSPGRQGFCMAVAADNHICGSIGGGIMEVKLVELAKDRMKKGKINILLKRQIHDKSSSKNQSGMICSGEQTVAIVPLIEDYGDALGSLFDTILEGGSGSLTITPIGLFFKPVPEEQQYHYHYTSENDWTYTENLGQNNVIHIIGGGHVGLALSRQMSFLNFYIKIYDDRDDVNTFIQNTFANEKHIVPYEKAGDLIPENNQHYVVVMTFGYKTDKLVIKQLVGKSFRYLGVMGSEAKIEQLLKELENEIPSEQTENFFAPIGLPIYSKTPEEIAVSIAAQIIFLKNKTLPTGRSLWSV